MIDPIASLAQCVFAQVEPEPVRRYREPASGQVHPAQPPRPPRLPRWRSCPRARCAQQHLRRPRLDHVPRRLRRDRQLHRPARVLPRSGRAVPPHSAPRPQRCRRGLLASAPVAVSSFLHRRIRSQCQNGFPRQFLRGLSMHRLRLLDLALQRLHLLVAYAGINPVTVRSSLVHVAPVPRRLRPIAPDCSTPPPAARAAPPVAVRPGNAPPGR